MVSDEHYDICLPILEDPTLEDEDRTDKLEEILRQETTLSGASLDNVVLDALWRYREGGASSASPPIRQTILRRPSPAYPWRTTSGTPISGSPRLGVSPLAPPGFGRPKPSGPAPSPFSSPRPSPLLALAQPIPIPHSPNLNAYEFACDPTPAPEIALTDHQAENVDWIVGGDDAISLSSSVGAASSMLNAAAPEFSSSLLSSSPSYSSLSAISAAAQVHQSDMTPYDMLRSILGQSKSDDEIEAALASNGYDLGATIASIMEAGEDGQGGPPPLPPPPPPTGPAEEPRGSFLVGKSMAYDARPSTPVGQQQQQRGIICKFFLSTGQCLRADCRFSHELNNHLCKYWIMGNCLAGDTCIFSHDPAQLLSKLALDRSSTPPPPGHTGSLPIHDHSSFPALQPTTPEHRIGFGSGPSLSLTPPPGFRPVHGSDIIRPRSRPGSRHHKEVAPALDDNEAFPSLGASAKQGKKHHHGKRGGHVHVHAHGLRESGPSLLADIVKMSPAGNVTLRPGSGRMIRNGSSSGMRHGENSVAAQAISSPKHVPWLETGDRANKAYLKARQDAIKHCGLRNKFLQSAAQAWNRNDARAAKALSLRGQSENELMRKAHRDAARELYEERNKHLSAGHGSNSAEIYIDLHGLHAEEALAYLEQVLLENENESRPVYAITGTGHHSKGGRDKVGRAVRNFLCDWRYAFREFSVPGDRNNMGGILGIDARSWDKTLGRDGSGGAGGGPVGLGAANGDDLADGGASLSVGSGGAAGAAGDEGGGGGEVTILSQGIEIGEGKVKLLVREPPRGPSGARW